ncbi:hypothetical protein [Hirschia baltica]|uniref:TonB C-terminal domain-containing protein n=1 Tax=Hirschia baltica (strain ATCC 49814 / DSM 5838 / IFAM 1418) TaxID=582402 RepID=C6XMD6_HIRBI|nr:hypothetical protein [Hirschia baltica]ACT58079.1 hypothetical protein Hbal_0377 [Hirschia baltica ATCC 49814]
MKLLFCIGMSAAILVMGIESEAVADANNQAVTKDWSKSKCMNFSSNKDIEDSENALKEAHSSKDFKGANALASELMDNKLGCQQRYEIADIGYKSAVALRDFSSAQGFLPVMRKHLKKKGEDVNFFDRLIQWVDENKAAHDADIEVADRDAFAIRDRTLHYVYKDFIDNRNYAGKVPTTLCEVNFAISEYGQPISVEAKCDQNEVQASLIKHIPKMLFAPKIVDGKPVVQERYGLKVRIE